MKRVTLHAFAAAAAVACAIAAAATLPRPQVEKAPFQLEADVPSRFGDWRIDPSVIPVAPTPDVQAKLEELYEQIVNRTYVNGAGQRVMLTIAYGGDQRDALRSHRQEVCYRAQGFAVRGLETGSFSASGTTVPVVRFHGAKSARSEPVTYWMTMGDRVIADRFDRLVAQVSYSVRTGAVPDGLVFRVSSLDADAAAGYDVQRRFLEELFRSLPPGLAAHFTGQAR